MPRDHLKSFLEDASQKAFDQRHRSTINYNIGKYDKAVELGKLQFSDLEWVRKKAKNIKWEALEHLDRYLLEFENKFTANGGEVIWAENAEQALEAVHKIIRETGAVSVVKSKSMATEEIELNEWLEKEKIEVLETDLGEYIVQLAGEKPYHIVTPAMHKSKDDIAALFHEKLGTPENLTAEQLTNEARKQLREKFGAADIGISGANFIIADSGSIAITENEGNARLTTSLPKIHIAIAGIEKTIPSINHLDLFWPLLASYGTGQDITVYNTVLSGPKRPSEADGPERMIVILLDNGRTELLAKPDKRESLYCIRCGSCLNACPVYKAIGGHSYGTVYSGPIGSVIMPHLKGMAEYNHLSHASSLCGNCTASCPVNINLHNLLIDNRHEAVMQSSFKKKEKTGWHYWKKGMLNRKKMNWVNGGIKSMAMKQLFGKSWGHNREMPDFPKKSFNQLWKESNN